MRLHWQAWQVLRKQHHRLDMLFQQALPPDARTRTRRHNPHYVHCFGALQRCQPPPLRDVRPHLARRFAACTSCVLQRSMVQRSMVWAVACVGAAAVPTAHAPCRSAYAHAAAALDRHSPPHAPLREGSPRRHLPRNAHALRCAMRNALRCATRNALRCAMRNALRCAMRNALRCATRNALRCAMRMPSAASILRAVPPPAGARSMRLQCSALAPRLVRAEIAPVRTGSGRRSHARSMRAAPSASCAARSARGTQCCARR